MNWLGYGYSKLHNPIFQEDPVIESDEPNEPKEYDCFEVKRKYELYWLEKDASDGKKTTTYFDWDITINEVSPGPLYGCAIGNKQYGIAQYHQNVTMSQLAGIIDQIEIKIHE